MNATMPLTSSFDTPKATDAVPKTATPSHRSFLKRIVLGPPGDASWARPALLGMLLLTAIAYMWNLTASGYANDFYAAAVQAGTKSWKAFLFGSADAANSITVDKTPGALWFMELSGRIFGFSSASMLIPNALEGVAAVGLLYASVKRWFGPVAGLLAGGILAITPVAALMFRFNNPDAALVFVLVAAAYFLTRAIESASTKWMVFTGLAIGFGFLVKEMQALLVVPFFGLAYLACAPTTFKRRVVQLLTGLVAMVAAAGWWLALVELWPVGSRPYIGGSEHNSILEVIFGYNGLGRITGNSAGNGGGGGGGGGANFSGTTGIGRLFNDLMAGQISWLLPAALISLVVGLFLCRRSTRTNRALAALIIWGGWLITTAITFSFASGTIHTYYTVALTPAIAAVIGIVVTRLWAQREQWFQRISLAVIVAVTGAWVFTLLDRTSSWNSWLRYFVIAMSVVSVAALLAEPWMNRISKRLGLAIATLCLLATLSAPAAFALQTVNTAHTGSIPSAGPSSGTSSGFGGGGTGGGRSFGGGTPPTGTGGFGGGGGMGGGQTANAAVTALLKTDASKYTWVAATIGSQSSAPYQLATGDPVMDIGGFNGGDPSPTLAQFEKYVAEGKIHYFIPGGGMGGGGGNSSSGTSTITTWVEAHYKAVTAGSTTLYDLTQPTATTTN